MQKIISSLAILLVSFPVLADGEFNSVPEPELFSLIGMGIAAYILSRRFTK